MNLIVAVDSNWAIGLNNELLAHIPEDQKFFRETTKDHVVVMGRKTLESFPGSRPLKNRTNIVLTRNKDYEAEGVVLVHDMEELRIELSKYPQEEIYIIGGENFYRQMLEQCDRAYVTKIVHNYEADACFPNLDEKPEWTITKESEKKTWEGMEFYFLTYEKKK